jgi:hypothetical protein
VFGDVGYKTGTGGVVDGAGIGGSKFTYELCGSGKGTRVIDVDDVDNVGDAGIC